MLIVFTSGSSSKQLICGGESFRRQMVCQMSVLPGSQLNSVFHFPSGHLGRRNTAATLFKSFGSDTHHGETLICSLFKQKKGSCPSSVSQFGSSGECPLMSLSVGSRICKMSLKLSVPKDESISRIRWKLRPRAWLFGGASAGLFISFASTKVVSTKADSGESKKSESTHGKQVFTDYSIIAIPGDGRCLFRSVVHGACLRSNEPVPNVIQQRNLADILRNRVADEFVKRRSETEWFLEDEFDAYVSRIRKPHVWGGEPELLMATHVLRMPITVYMHDANRGGLIAIAEYGQEYGKENPIRVLYHGSGHYEALQVPASRGQNSRL